MRGRPAGRWALRRTRDRAGAQSDGDDDDVRRSDRRGRDGGGGDGDDEGRKIRSGVRTRVCQGSARHGNEARRRGWRWVHGSWVPGRHHRAWVCPNEALPGRRRERRRPAGDRHRRRVQLHKRGLHHKRERQQPRAGDIRHRTERLWPRWAERAGREAALVRECKGRLGVAMEEDTHLGVYLFQDDVDYKMRSVDVSLVFKLLNHANDEETITKKLTRKFVNTTNGRGFKNFIGWDTVTKANEGFIKDSKLSVQVNFSLSNVIILRQIRRMDFTDPNEPSHDVTLVIGNDKVYVSKQHLSIYSPVFHRMFYGGFKEENQKEIELNEIDHKEFIGLLNVIYPPFEKITGENVDYILKLSDRFEMVEVTEQAEQYLMISSLFTVAEKLSYAGRYRLLELQDDCLDQLKTSKDVRDLQNSNGFKDFTDAIHTALYNKFLKFTD